MPDASGRPMAASAVAEIEAVIQTYFDGLYEGNVDKLAAAFHPVSHLYCEKDGGVLDVPRDAVVRAGAQPPFGGLRVACSATTASCCWISAARKPPW